MYHKWKSYNIKLLRYGAPQTELLVFWAIFCPFIPLTIWKIKILKKKNKQLEISSLYASVPQMTIIWYGSLDMEHNRHNFFVILDHFLPFYHNNPKNQDFEKMKKTPRDIIILHKCTKNHDHVLYCSWDLAHERCNCYFSLWAIFCPFTPLTAWKLN